LVYWLIKVASHFQVLFKGFCIKKDDTIMKECCKDGCHNTTEKSVVRKWLNYVIYTILVLIVGGALALQLFG
jgi:hypothetical protein